MTRTNHAILLAMAALLQAVACLAVNRCGTSYSDAASKCDKCPGGYDGQCPTGETCYAGLSGCTESSGVNRCGTSYSDAGIKCDKCPNGIDSECPSGETCYAGLPDCSGDTSPSPRASPPSPQRHSPPSPAAGDCTYEEAAGRGIDDLCANQVRNAEIIINLGRDNGIPEYGWVVALSAALVESRLVNVDFGDRDSVGLFQQRCKVGWCQCGSGSECLDPELASRAFYGFADHTSNPGLTDVDGWQNMTVSDAAQAVQVSCCPERYGEQEELARQIIAAYA